MQTEVILTTNGKKKTNKKTRKNKQQKSKGNLFTNIWRKNVRWDSNKKMLSKPELSTTFNYNILPKYFYYKLSRKVSKLKI